MNKWFVPLIAMMVLSSVLSVALLEAALGAWSICPITTSAL